MRIKVKISHHFVKTLVHFFFFLKSSYKANLSCDAESETRSLRERKRDKESEVEEYVVLLSRSGFLMIATCLTGHQAGRKGERERGEQRGEKWERRR